MDIDKIIEKETQLLSVTGLYRSEFEELHRVFKPRWEQAFKHFDTRGKCLGNNRFVLNFGIIFPVSEAKNAGISLVLASIFNEAGMRKKPK